MYKKGDLIAVEGEEKTSPITVEPNARVWMPQAVADITIVGMGLSGVQLMSDVYQCNFRKPGVKEIWVLNHSAMLLQHDLAFNMGDLTDPLRLAGPGISFLDLYKDHPQPVITTRYIREIKNCYEFPWEMIFNAHNDYYFQSGPSYLVALAILSLMMYKKDSGKNGTLRLYGLDFNYPGANEYEKGRCCVEYWIGRAKQLGINILVPEITSLLDQNLYNTTNGLQGNGFCYGLGTVRPIFGQDEGRIYLKAFKDSAENVELPGPRPEAFFPPVTVVQTE